MKRNKDEILFISHKSNRSGAAILLLEIIREFMNQSSMPVKIILMEKGPLLEDFRKLAPVYCWVPKKNRLATILNGLIIMFLIRKSTIVFSNTITNGHLQKKLLFLRARWMTYIHELAISIHSLTNAETLKTVLDNTDYFLAGSNAVRQNLMQMHRVPADKISVVYSSIPAIIRERTDPDKQKALRQELRIPEGSLVIGVAGENEWRKGFDWFAPLVRIYLNAYPESRAFFLWMGIRKERMGYFGDMNDFEKFGIHDRVHLIEHGSRYLEYMSVFDIHLLLSREDPFPLVVLDAASFSTPTICFLQGGGTPEFVESDAGICVPYGDLTACARAIHELEISPGKRVKLGIHAREKLATGFDQREATANIIKLIKTNL